MLLVLRQPFGPPERKPEMAAPGRLVVGLGLEAQLEDVGELVPQGMAELGLRPFLDSSIQAPIIVTFHAPVDTRYTFREFYDRVRDKGFILYPGKLTQLETFRVGCIGAIGPDEMRHAVNAVRDTLADMGIRRVAPGETATRAAA